MDWESRRVAESPLGPLSDSESFHNIFNKCKNRIIHDREVIFQAKLEIRNERSESSGDDGKFGGSESAFQFMFSISESISIRVYLRQTSLPVPVGRPRKANPAKKMMKRLILVLFIAHIVRVACFMPLSTTFVNFPWRKPASNSATKIPASHCSLLPCLSTQQGSTSSSSENLGPAEKVQRSLARDAGVGREDAISNTVAKLIELRRRGLKYDGTPLSADAKATDSAKLMEKMMREAEKFLGS